MTEYVNFKEGLDGRNNLIPVGKELKITNPDKDYYRSIWIYSEEHKKHLETVGNLKKVKNLYTNELVFDFDSVNVEDSRLDTVSCALRLVNKYNIHPDDLDCYFSGNKGFHISIFLKDKKLSPEQVKQSTLQIAGDLKTFDTTIWDTNQIIRMPNTKNPKSGLFKIPLHISDIETKSVTQIKELAKRPMTEIPTVNQISLPEELFKIQEKPKKELTVSNEKFDPKSTPKGWKPYKWAIAQGFFEGGDRHNALLVLAATCRGLGYDKKTTYYLCKSALKEQAARYGQDEFGKEELWNNIIEESVFSDGWEGGQYSPKTNPWLGKYCEKMGFKVEEEKDESPTVSLDSLIDIFVDYSTNFEHNIIKTGVTEIDENVIFSTSTLNGVLGQPGSGKTTLVLEFLEHTSLNSIPSMLFSLDMGPPLIFSKLIQKQTGLAFKDSIKLYRENKEEREKINALIKHKYKNIGMNFTCGSTVSDIRNKIIEHGENTGIKPKLIVIDYLENIAGPFSDTLANAAMISNQLKDLATELQVCVLLLLQTQKHSTPDISDPLMSMKQIKGASSIEQNCSVVMTLWREGYNPDHVADDKYISFAVVKNRFGPMWKTNMHWEPIRGKIRSLTEEEIDDLEEFKKRKRLDKINALNDKPKKEWQ